MNRALSWLRRIRRDECGATALEFAIIGSALVIVTMGIIEFGRSLQVRNEMAFAMDHGARTLLMDRDATEVEIKDAIKARLAGYDVDKLQVTAPDSTIACKYDGADGTMDVRTVNVTYTLDIFIPGVTKALQMNLARIVPTGQCVV